MPVPYETTDRWPIVFVPTLPEGVNFTIGRCAILIAPVPMHRQSVGSIVRVRPAGES